MRDAVRNELKVEKAPYAYQDPSTDLPDMQHRKKPKIRPGHAQNTKDRRTGVSEDTQPRAHKNQNVCMHCLAVPHARAQSLRHCRVRRCSGGAQPRSAEESLSMIDGRVCQCRWAGALRHRRRRACGPGRIRIWGQNRNSESESIKQNSQNRLFPPPEKNELVLSIFKTNAVC